jgi:hypothetical protein
MIAFIISMLVALLFICVVAAIVYYILQALGIPGQFLRFVWAVAGLVFLIWLLENYQRAGLHI